VSFVKATQSEQTNPSIAQRDTRPKLCCDDAATGT
jgi:hypothetical protein